jgi:hypothetical protein
MSAPPLIDTLGRAFDFSETVVGAFWLGNLDRAALEADFASCVAA